MSKIEGIGVTHDQPWTKVVDVKDFSQQALVYELRASDGNGQPVPVEHDGITDPEGTLYIGEQSDDVSRFEDLVTGLRSHNPKCKHDAPKRYYDEGWDKKFPLEKLEVRVTLMARPSVAGKNFTRADGTSTTEAAKHTATDGKVAARNEERRRLRAKEHQIGRIPTLNRSAGVHTRQEAPTAVDPNAGDDGSLEIGEGADAEDKLAELRAAGQPASTTAADFAVGGPATMPSGQPGVDIMINRLRKRTIPAGPLRDRWKEIFRRWSSPTERLGVGPDEIRKLNSDIDAAEVKP